MDKYLVVGLGKTGMSCLRYLCAQNSDVALYDTRAEPPLKQKFLDAFPNINYVFGDFDPTLADTYSHWVVSPGLDYKKHDFSQYIKSSTVILSDIDLGLNAIQVPVVAVTGSNGKSTVSSLVTEMILASGKKAQLVGNIGAPILDHIADDVDVYVLECSSFQLALSQPMQTAAAVCLNMTADHLDVHGSMANYLKIKQRIYDCCDVAVVNLDDQSLYPGELPDTAISYALHTPATFFLRDAPAVMLSSCNFGDIIPLADVSPALLYYPQNILAALALASVLQVPLDACVRAIKVFKGLPHRLLKVAEVEGVCWYNDSKATNVGSAEAALRSLSQQYQKKIIWIAGGQAKGADLSVLNEAIAQTVKAGVFMGEATAELVHCCEMLGVPAMVAHDMDDAVNHAKKLAQSGDVVVLAPACASFDMFDNFMDRGAVFEQLLLR